MPLDIGPAAAHRIRGWAGPFALPLPCRGRECEVMAAHRVVGALAVAGLVFTGAACGDAEIEVNFGDNDRVKGSGSVVAEIRTIDDFDRIVLTGEGEVLFGVGSDGAVEIETDDNLLAHIDTEVDGGTLTISTERNIDIDPSDGVVYRLGCPSLAGARLSGAGTIDIADCATSDQLELTLSGAGTIRAPEVDVALLEVSIPGAGRIVAEGDAERLELTLSGAGNFEAADLEAVDAEVRSTGVGSTVVWVTGELDLQFTGVGSVRYYGEPAISQSVTGVGSVESLGTK